MPPGHQQHPGYMPQSAPPGYMPPMYPPGFMPYMQQPGFVPPYMPPGFPYGVPPMAPGAPVQQQLHTAMPNPVPMTSSATGKQAHYSSGLFCYFTFNVLTSAVGDTTRIKAPKPEKTSGLFALHQRCPTHSPLATFGEYTFECGEWLCFQISQNQDVLSNILDEIKNLHENNTFLLKT